MDKNKDSENSHPRLLKNTPCDKDMFEGQSHQYIANAIAKTIHTHNDANIIGVDGGWGSGKSNLVGLVQKTLNKEYTDINYHFFVYDAWGHQDDLQRRSILEELTDQLINGTKTEKAVLDTLKWEGRLKDLLARKRETETTSIPKLSCGIILSALAVIATPILKVIAEDFIDNSCCKILIMVIPISILFLWFFIRFVINLFRYKTKRIGIALKTSVSDVFSVYSDKKINNKTNEIISEKEPSSREFKKWIHHIDEDLSANKLIIVFDNMDRLPATKVQELWAVIHSFFADQQYKNIRVIVPFDRAHIISAFKNEDISQIDNRVCEIYNENASPVENHKSRTTKIQCYGDDFINKTFNVIYRVSPPTMSNWKQFFNERWKDAFGESLSQDSRITQIYDLLTEYQTPRKIIAFINEFVSIKQMCSEHNIPDQYIALFIFGKSRITLTPETEIISPTYLGAMAFLYADDKEMPKYICALYYQLHPDKAIDIIYTDRIKWALDNNEFEAINSIKTLAPCRILLENAIAKVTNVPNATIALNTCFGNEQSDAFNNYWDCLYQLTKNTFPSKLEEYQKILLRKIKNKKEYLISMINEFYKDDNFNVFDFHHNINELSSIDGIEPFLHLNTKQVKSEEFIQFVGLAKATYKKFKIICDKDELDSYLSGLNIEKLKNLDIIPFIKEQYKTLSQYEKNISSLIDKNVNDATILSDLFERLKELKRPIEKTIADNEIYAAFIHLKEDDSFYFDLICMRISRLSSFSTTHNSYFAAAMNRKDDIFVEKVAKKLEYYIDYEKILLNLPSMNYPLYKAVAKRLTENSYEQPKMTISKVLVKYEEIINNSDIEPKALINNLNRWKNHTDGSINETNITSIPVLFFRDSVQIDNELVKCCQKLANEYLNGRTVENWVDSITNNDSDYQLFDVLQPNTQNYFDAVKNLLVRYASEEIPALDKEKIKNALEWANIHNYKLLGAFNDVRDRFCVNGKMNVAYFDFYGEWLFDYSKLYEKKEVLRAIFKYDILDQERNIELILKYQNTMLKVVQKADDERNDFIGKISQLLADKYSDNLEFIAFAKLLGIEQKQEDDKDAPSKD